METVEGQEQAITPTESAQVEVQETPLETPVAEPQGEPVEEAPVDEQPPQEEAEMAEVPKTEAEEHHEEEVAEQVAEQKTVEVKKEVQKKMNDSQKSSKQKQLDTLERRKKIAAEQANDTKLAEEAAKNSKIVLCVECCVNCVEHQYCTHHKEEKYKEYMSQLKTEIEKLHPDIWVSKNYKIARPQIGALEVRWGEQVVYSKLKEMRWPNAAVVAKKLQELREKEVADKLQAEEQKKVETERQKKQEELKMKEAEEAESRRQVEPPAEAENLHIEEVAVADIDASQRAGDNDMMEHTGTEDDHDKENIGGTDQETYGLQKQGNDATADGKEEENEESSPFKQRDLNREVVEG